MFWYRYPVPFSFSLWLTRDYVPHTAYVIRIAGQFVVSKANLSIRAIIGIFLCMCSVMPTHVHIHPTCTHQVQPKYTSPTVHTQLHEIYRAQTHNNSQIK